MTHDIVIRGGDIVDGLGGEPYRADLGIKGGKIAEIGQIAAKGVDLRGSSTCTPISTPRSAGTLT